MRKLKFASLIALLSLAIAACSGDKGLSFESASPAQEDVATEPEAKQADVTQNTDDAGSERTRASSPAAKKGDISLQKADQSSSAQPAKPITRKIIRNAKLQLETGTPKEVQKKITSIAEAKKGFVVQSRERIDVRNRGQKTVSMTLRIPAEEFGETLEEVRKTASRVIDESVSGRDVTEEFIDIEARLKTKKALEERFLEIMKQSRSVKDALNVQRELANVRTEIERIEGRKRFLENQSSLSTITIDIRTPTALSGSSSGFWYEVKEAISDGFDAALSFILILIRVLIAILPFLILVVLPVLLVLRYFWRSYKKKRAARKFVEEELNDLEE